MRTDKPERSRRGTGAWLALSLLLCACGGGSADALVILSVSNLPDGAGSLLLSAQLDGKEAMQLTIMGRLDHFSVRLPPGAQGQLALDLSAVVPDGCAGATGHGETHLGGTFPVQLSIALRPQVPEQCPLTITPLGAGTGSVTSSPAGIQCGPRCIGTFARGSTVSLAARADLSSYSLGLGGSCAGARQCQVTVDGPLTVSATFAPKVCVSDHLCWESPLPQGHSLRRVFQVGAGDAWVVGQGGTILHWDGTTFSGPRSGTTQELRGVWAGGPMDAWAVGAQGTILHYDGTGWRGAASGTTSDLDAVWGSGPGDVWAVGAQVIVHYDGKKWTATPAPAALHGVWGTGSRNVLAVGDQGTVMRWDGTSWGILGEAMLATGRDLYDVWGTGPLNVWVVGAGGTVLGWNGDTRWTVVQINVTDDLYAISGSGSEAWAVGAGGATLHLAGGAWTVADRAPGTLRGVAVAGTVLAAGDQGLLARHDAMAWQRVDEPQPVGNRGFALGAADAWTVGGSGEAYHFDGDRWRLVKSGSTNALRAIWGSKSDDVWLVGDAGQVEQGAIFHWNGDTITIFQSPAPSTRFYDLWASGPTDQWAVGAHGGGEEGPVAALIYHGTGSQAPWTQVYRGTTTAELYGVWGSGPDDVWAVGEGGLVLHGQGMKGWTPVDSGTTSTLRRVWGRAAQDFWIIGDSVILHGNGTTLTAVPSGTMQALRAMYGTGAGDIWVAGSGGTLLHGDGRTFTPVPSGLSSDLLDVFGAGDGSMWVLTGEGALRYLP